MSNEKYVQIGNICVFIPGSQPPKSQFVNKPKPGYVRLIQIRDRLNDNFITFIPRNSTNKFVKTNEILIGRYGPPIFQVFRGLEGAYNVAIMKAVPKEGVDNDYLYYFLLQKDLLHYVESMSLRTAGQTGVQLDSLYKYPVRRFVLSEQKSIARVLKTIDDKISNNNAICADLEAMAKLLYDYWFVQYDFPDENGKPYKSSGGQMVWNEELKREIPEGWEVSKLGIECEILLGGTPDTKESEYWDGDIPWLNSGEVASSPVLTSEKRITEKGKNNTSTAFAEVGTIVMSITRYIRPSILGIDACFNQSVVAVKPTKRFRTSFLYPFMKSNVDRYMSLRTGAQQPHINKEIVEETLFLCPPENVLEKYYEKVELLYAYQLNVSKESLQLASLRDFLLPMLMNGQVKVGKGEA